MNGIKSNAKMNLKRRIRAEKKSLRKKYNLIDDLQWKCAHWFLNSFKEILVSRLYVACSSGINKQYMNDSEHCRFVDRLNYLSMFYKGRRVHTGKEYYTSQHCTSCGSLKTIKDAQVKCKDCKFEIHRDLSGSRNFLIKYLRCNPQN